MYELIGLGFKDENFLGRNISLKLNGNFGTNRNDYNMDIRLPRQLLKRWKITGDYHGQAAVLWASTAMVRLLQKNNNKIKL